MKRLRIIFMLSLVLLAACDADDKYSNRYACNFMFYTKYHDTSILTRSLGNPGAFTIVKVEKKDNVNRLLISSNSGMGNEEIKLTSALENERISYQNMGANRSLIIGCSNFNGLKAYDRQCPNCIDEFGGVNYPLEFDENDAVVCNKCKRLYLLNSEGMAVSGEKGDHALLQYRVEYNGEQMFVHN